MKKVEKEKLQPERLQRVELQVCQVCGIEMKWRYPMAKNCSAECAGEIYRKKREDKKRLLSTQT